MSNQFTYNPPFTEMELRRHYDAGLTQHEIAKLYLTSQKVVWTAMRHFGITCRIPAKRDQRGSNNSCWKGDKAGYAALHKRVESKKGRPKKCEVCGTSDESKRYHWANLTGRYDDPDDYKRMCVSCHNKHDRRIENILKTWRKRERYRKGGS